MFLVVYTVSNRSYRYHFVSNIFYINMQLLTFGLHNIAIKNKSHKPLNPKPQIIRLCLQSTFTVHTLDQPSMHIVRSLLQEE